MTGHLRFKVCFVGLAVSYAARRAASGPTKGSAMPPSQRPRKIGPDSVGIFSADEWLAEGYGLFASARSTRAAWRWKRRRLPRRTGGSGPSQRLWAELTGLPRASTLLLGYSVEMYLKAGLVKAYRGCREEMFDHDIRNKFRHHLRKLASEIDLPNAEGSADDLQLLQGLIEGDRYPITPEDVLSLDIAAHRRDGFISQANRRAAFVWSDARFRRLCALAKNIGAHAARIDCDENNSVSYVFGDIGNTGYWTFRIGGRLKPRLTYRLCPSLPSVGLDDVKGFIESNPVFGSLAWDEVRTHADQDERRGRCSASAANARSSVRS